MFAMLAPSVCGVPKDFSFFFYVCSFPLLPVRVVRGARCKVKGARCVVCGVW